MVDFSCLKTVFRRTISVSHVITRRWQYYNQSNSSWCMFGVFDGYGNRMFDCKAFITFDAAWNYIDTMFPSDDDLYSQLEARELL